MKNTIFDYFAFSDPAGGRQDEPFSTFSDEDRQEQTRNRQKLSYSLRRCLQEDLTPRQREMLRLYIGEQLTKAQIARQLGVGRPAVTRCLNRALAQLERSIRRDMEIGEWELPSIGA
jgi:RNA polymerase sigma factor (sigma-70 family)